MKVLVDYENLLKAFVMKDNFLYGVQGFCLVKDNNMIQKIYFNSKDMRKVFDLSCYRSDKIAFPYYYLFDSLDDLQVVGEVMPYYDMESITTSLNYSCNIDKFIYHYYAMLEEIKKFPEVWMYDVCSPNVLYNEEKGFSLIDTTDWKISSDIDYSKNNIGQFINDISEIIVRDLLGIYPITLCNTDFQRNLSKYGKKGEELFKLFWASVHDPSHIIEILEIYKLMFGYNNHRIKTFGDMEKYTKKLKKG